MFTSKNFTQSEVISLSKEIALIGVEATPFTSLLMSKGNIEKALSTVYTWREKTIDTTDDISAVEGSDDIVFYESARKELNNVLEIFSKGAKISGTAIAMQSGQLDQEIAERILELKINMEKKFLLGTKDTGEASGIRRMGGLVAFADEGNAVPVTGAVTKDTIKQAMRNLWNQNLAEGQYYLFVNADIKEQIDALYEGAYGYQHKETNFGLIVETLNTNYGVVNVVLSKHVPADKAILFNDAYVDLAYLRQPHFEPLAKTGDNVKGMVIAEATLKVGSKKAVGVITVTPQA
ncbi:SU10 major capsid protein [Priestia filamentosa]|uniref:SU10 major capsid protein n=1 Tax=Priestia filamentosa TaxID=1402861 RepID=UPI000A08BA84|nr:DUF5309 family protein [Priestia filamentosa]OXS67234.1 phage capsid protein [Priestia filamentosa]SMF53523.1 hypothetical protein SAMN06296056_104238 [Priestia filamentosa]